MATESPMDALTGPASGSERLDRRGAWSAPIVAWLSEPYGSSSGSVGLGRVRVRRPVEYPVRGRTAA
jgi:hypothetical protein